MNLRILGPLKGSVSRDFEQHIPLDENPLPKCPDSPNCVRISRKYDVEPEKLFSMIEGALKRMKVHELHTNSHELQMDAVFRIPVFGFLDDVIIKIDPMESDSVLYIRSASREGYSDLGVNRRRVSRLLSFLNQK